MVRARRRLMFVKIEEIFIKKPLLCRSVIPQKHLSCPGRTKQVRRKFYDNVTEVLRYRDGRRHGGRKVKKKKRKER